MRRRLSYVLLSLGTVLLVGCGGSSGSGKSGASNGVAGVSTDFESFKPSNEFTLSPKLVQLDTASGFSVVSVSDTGVVLKNAPALSAGQIILHNSLDDKSFCRKVVSSSVSGSTTTVTTARAYMTDVFASANINGRQPMGQDTLNKLVSVDPTVTISPATPQARALAAIVSDSREQKEGAITFNFKNTIIRNSSNGKAAATFNGQITLGLGVEYNYVQSGLVPQSFRLAPYFKIGGTMSASAFATGNFSAEIPIATSPPVPLGALAALGITGDVHLLLKVDGSFNANGNFAATATLKAGGGLGYTRAGGFQPVGILEKTFSMTGPTVDGAAQIGVSLVRPQVGMHLPGGLADLTATSDAARAVISAVATNNPAPGVNLNVFGELNATVAGRVGLGPLTLWQDTKSYNLVKYDVNFGAGYIAGLTGSTSGTIAYLAPNGSGIHFANPDGSNDRTIISAPSGAVLSSPRISPRGTKLAYFVGGTNAAGLYVTGANGTSPRRLALNGISSSSFAWKPDGTELAVAGVDATKRSQIYAVNVSTGAVRNVTKSSVPVFNPSWSATSPQIYVDYSPASGGNQAIGAFSSTASGQDFIAGIVSDPAQVLVRPAISPDGKTLVMETLGLGLAVSPTGTATGTATDIVLDLPNFRPAWSPDGNGIVSQIVDAGVPRIVTYNRSGGNKRAIAKGTDPSWGASN